MYTINAMVNLINITQARNNLSRLIQEVFTRKKTYILLRDSIPQAVIIPYDQYQLQEQNWQEEVKKLMKDARRNFKKWLKKQKLPFPANEKQLYQLVDQVAGRC